MRAKNQWTPGGLVLWLIAAVAATFLVCSKSPPEQGTPESSASDEVEVEVLE